MIGFLLLALMFVGLIEIPIMNLMHVFGMQEKLKKDLRFILGGRLMQQRPGLQNGVAQSIVADDVSLAVENIWSQSFDRFQISIRWFGYVWMCFDVFGSVQMHSDVSVC